MRKALSVIILTATFLVAMDVVAATVLWQLQSRHMAASVVRYFDYGRSVPGKIAEWEQSPDLPGNLLKVGWRSDLVHDSIDKFRNAPDTGPVLREYGMSFVNHIMDAAQNIVPGLPVDRHSGPNAPPNYTYALFQDDHANRRPGDIAIFGVLSNALDAMAALSNSTWAFEQPAPFTYPVYELEGDGLKRVEPVIENVAAYESLSTNPELARAWTQQLSQHDAYYSPLSFGATFLDISPFARLVRRSAAVNNISQAKKHVLSAKGYPYPEVLRRMVREFAATARADGQIPVVVLVQSSADDPDVLAITKPALQQDDIPYLATIDYYDPRNTAGFIADGHYKPEIDHLFGEGLIKLLRKIAPGLDLPPAAQTGS